AVEAAMTGHLVFSTLHTNSAIGAISRLFEMGIEPFLLGASLNTVLAQRLVRRIHEDCKVDYMPTESEQAELERYGLKLEGPLKHGKGCDGCMETGYKGRTGIHELFVVSKETRELIGKGVTDDQIEAQTQQEGMQFLREDGLRKVLRGITTLEEIYRVTVEA
ncbi:MAG: GspE/PulE family protein, partial [Candidatus Bipolaricaulia bacterium]